MLVLPFSVETFGPSQALADELHIPLGRGDAPLRFLLECMQDIDRLRKPDCIDSTPGVAIVVCDNLNHRPPTKAQQWLGRRIGFPLLGSIEGLANLAPDLGAGSRAGPCGLSRSTPVAVLVLSTCKYMSTDIFCQPRIAMPVSGFLSEGSLAGKNPRLIQKTNQPWLPGPESLPP